MPLICPVNTYPGSPDLPVRHAIDFSGVSDIRSVVIPSRMEGFRGFLFSPKHSRVSFLTARGSFCRSGSKFFKDGKWYSAGDFFSQDPNIHEFNRLFIQANPRLSYYDPNDPTKPYIIKTYDFLDKGDERAGAYNSFSVFRKEVETGVAKLPSKVGGAFTFLLYGAAAVAVFRVYQATKGPKPKSA